MKTNHRLSLLLSLAAALSSPATTRGQDALPPPPPGEDVRKPEAPPPPPGRDGDKDRAPPQRDRDPRRGGPEMKPTPYIGIMTRELPPEVAAQAGLKEGFGLLVQDVMEDSPATKAGLQQHDVIVLFNDQRIVNIEQLGALVKAEGKDKEVTLSIRRAGQEQKVSLKIGEKMMPTAPSFGDRHGGFPDFRPFMNDMRGMSEHWKKQADHLRDQGSRFRGHLEDYQERLQDWMRGPKDRPMPEPPAFDGDRRPDGPPGRDGGKPPRGEARSESQSESRSESRGPDGKTERTEVRVQSKALSRRDDTGEYRLSLNEDGQFFIAHPKDGEEQKFSIATPEDRQKIPENLRGKLEELERMSKEVPAPPSRPRQDGDGPRPPANRDSI